MYVRVPHFFREFSIAKGVGRYPKLMLILAKTYLLVLDDFGTLLLNSEHRRDLLEILDDRYRVLSTQPFQGQKVTTEISNTQRGHKNSWLVLCAGLAYLQNTVHRSWKEMERDGG